MRLRGLIACAAMAASACGGASAAVSSPGGGSAVARSSDDGARAPRSSGGGSAGVRPSGVGARAVSAPCGPAGATTLAASAVARVYASGGTVFGCSKSVAGLIQLGQTRSCIGHAQIASVVVRGELAGYEVRQCGVDTGQARVVVRRLSNRRVIHQAPAVQTVTAPESYSGVGSLVLAADGSLAWIGTSSSIVSQGAGVTEVHAVDRLGARLLDSGAAVGARSLRLRGRIVSWRHGAAARTARLS